MNNTKSLLLTGVRAAIFGAIAFGAASAMAWTAAPANPPANNVAAPLNTSATAQSKAGKLSTTNAGFYVDLSRGDSWSVVTNGNVYASDVYSFAANKWLSDASTGGALLGVAVSNKTSNVFTATVPAGATYAVVSVDGTTHGGGGDQAVVSGKIYLDLVGRKSTGTFIYTTDAAPTLWSNVNFGTAIVMDTDGANYNTTVNLTGSTLTFNIPGDRGAAFFQFYQ